MYLKTLEIRNFRGIENLKVKFHENINVIIGPNGVCKTAVIDAIRLFPDFVIVSPKNLRQRV